MTRAKKIRETPIQVNPSSAAAQAETGGRYALTAIGAYALGRGWIADDTLQLVLVLVSVLAPGVWGVYRTWRNRQTLVTVAEAAPDSVATVARPV